MSNQDNRQKGRIAMGDWKKELMTLLWMKGRVSSGKGKQKPVSDRTLDAREAVLFMCMKQVRAMGFDIKSVYSLRGKHIEALLDKWKADGIGAGSIQNRLAILRALSRWIGKEGLVLPTRHYSLDAPERLRRQVSATDDKSWSARGVDPAQVIAMIAGLDHYVAMQLRLMDAFGLRREEAIQFKPHVCHQGNQLRVRDGTKGGRERMIPIESDKQRKVLEDAKQIVARWDGAIATPEQSLKQNLNRFDYIMQRAGLTKKGLGITAHGLRHQRLNDEFEQIAGVPSPVRQMSGVPVIIKGDPEKWKQAQQKVSSIAGHARLNIAAAYTGSAQSVKTPRLDWTAGLLPKQGEAAPAGGPSITVRHTTDTTDTTDREQEREEDGQASARDIAPAADSHHDGQQSGERADSIAFVVAGDGGSAAEEETVEPLLARTSHPLENRGK